ncbi:MAG: hypothetical protein ACE5JQ_01185 [Candidatus Methylomirabilales bacterium]
MSTKSSSEDLLEQWKESMQRGMDAWLAMIGQTPQPDIYQYWMPFFSQGMVPLSQMVSQGASPEILQQWKRFLDQGVEAWSKALEKAMASETFASAFGKYLDQYIGAVGPMQKEMKKASEAYLRALGLPSRTQIAEMTSQISWVETRIEELEAKIEQVLDGLASVQTAIEKGGTQG